MPLLFLSFRKRRNAALRLMQHFGEIRVADGCGIGGVKGVLVDAGFGEKGQKERFSAVVDEKRLRRAAVA